MEKMRFILKKSKDTIKRLLALTLCLTIGSSLAISFSAEEAFGENQYHSGYKWHRIYSQTQLSEIVNKGSDGVLNDSPADDPEDIRKHGWVRLMIIYDNEYFTSKSNGDENWEGRRILGSYDIKAGADSFITRSGLDTPYIKYQGSGSNYYIRFCKEGTDFLSKDFLSYQVSWYGIKEASACYGEFVLGPPARVDDTNYGKGKATASCSRSRYPYVQIHFGAHWSDYFTGGITEKQYKTLMAAYDHKVKEYRVAPGGGIYTVEVDPSSKDKISWTRKNCTDESKYDLSIFDKVIKNDTYPYGITDVEAYDKVYKAMCRSFADGEHDASEGMAWLGYDIPGACDRYWHIYGSEIGSKKYDKNDFMLYWGEPYETPSYGEGESGEYTVPAGTTIFNNYETVSPQFTINVPYGSTLIVSGHVVNNGMISVNGGTLLIRDCLDNDVGTDQQYDGSVSVSNGGSVIVEKDGCILTRRGNSVLSLTDQSSVTVFGAVDFTWLTADDGCTVRVAPGGLLALGVTANDTVEYKNLVSGSLSKYKDNTLNSFFKKCDTRPDCTLENGCSLIVEGSFVAPDCVKSAGEASQIYCDNTSYMNVWKETDLSRTVNQSMRYW